VPPRQLQTLEQWDKDVDEFFNALVDAIQRPETTHGDICLLLFLITASRMEDQGKVKTEKISRLQNLLHLDREPAGHYEEEVKDSSGGPCEEGDEL
jgi:hypothetical protein